jgi:type IV fimbrial biogenesis protein FimT
VLAVVIIIGIFAAAASPMFINLMRDRRVNRAAMEVTGMYRLARTRALGRSNPVLVRWRAAGPDFGFEVREGIVRRSGPVLAEGCLSITDWQDLTQAQYVTAFRPEVGLGQLFELAALTFLDEDGNAQSFAEMCFSARGRTFVRYVEGGTWNLVSGVPRVNVMNTRTTLVRTVFIPPNGVARMAL